uniref:Uncharacterized protein n=1 Tax=Megaselia scalaris TaxID=36166 RepID=T1GMY0_MEGSC
MKNSYTVNYIAFTRHIQAVISYLKGNNLMEPGDTIVDTFPGHLVDLMMPKLPILNPIKLKQMEMEKEEKELPQEKEENIPEEVSLQNEPLKNTDEIASKEIPVEIVKENLTPSDPKKDLEKVSPKKASKPRRNKKSKSRNDVDMDDVEERDDQYVGWVPPQNQSGDGRSSLNDKYGISLSFFFSSFYLFCLVWGNVGKNRTP